ncbi:MAG: glutamine-hydrolyzing carbamoyl-phosphate synthase small subunit [Actinomycetota bacterium]
MSEARAWNQPALLALEDGTVFRGEGMGASGTTTGEVCFNTAMTGYQEVLTDPSYHGQIVAMTAPQIGNTGTNDADDQSRRPFVAGFVVRDASEYYSSWRASGSLDDYLHDRDVVGISGVDTRRLTRHLRTRGAMRGALSTEVRDIDEVVDIARSSPGLVGRDLASEVSTTTPYTWTAENVAGHLDLMVPARIAAFDFGLKRNILDLLVSSGCEVTVWPARTESRVILNGGYDGVFLSNGPGDPEPVDYGIATVGELLGRIPVFGICLGHQILALALGARTYKLPFGHRGGNHPVARVTDPRVEITCQNHGFAVEESSLATTAAHLTHVNLNDRTVEGLEVPGVAFSVQYHPESGPGPHDSRYLFEDFMQLIDRFDPAEVDRIQSAQG